jgi:hypothetical protein
VERGLHHRFSQLFKPGTKLISVEAGSKESNKKKKKKGEKKNRRRRRRTTATTIYTEEEREAHIRRGRRAQQKEVGAGNGVKVV